MAAFYEYSITKVYKCMRMMLWVQKSGDTALILCAKSVASAYVRCFAKNPNTQLSKKQLAAWVDGATLCVREQCRGRDVCRSITNAV